MGLKNGFIFTLDAILAVFILVGGIVLMHSLYVWSPPSQISYVSQDVLEIFSTVRVDEVDNLYVRRLIDDGEIRDPSTTIIRQIAEFWVSDKQEYAYGMAQNLTEDYIPDSLALSIEVFNGTDYEVVFNQTKNNTKYTISRTRMISGIEKYKPVIGVSARAYLKKTNLKTSSFAYFGGFVGQGNISVLIRDIPADAELLGMVVEVDAADDFSLNINNIACDYSPSQFDFVPDLDENMTAEQWDIMNCNQSILLGGDNAFEFVMPENINTSYIAGGFVKVTYLTEQTDRGVNTGSSRYYLPGIVGFANLYDSFYVPGTLHNLSLRLHFKNNYTSNFTIGNVTVLGREGEENERTIELTSDDFQAMQDKLDFSRLSRKTIPIRYGTEEFVFEGGSGGGGADAVVVTDVSGSMHFNCFGCNHHTCTDTIPGGCSDADGCRICDAKQADRDFVDVLLPNSSPTTSRVGLVSYASTLKSQLGLTGISDKSDLMTEINTYQAGGGTCISCGIHGANGILSADWDAGKEHALLVMTDGNANQQVVGSPCSSISNAKEEAVCTGWHARQQGITVYSIGFDITVGSSGDNTMKGIACFNCQNYNHCDPGAGEGTWEGHVTLPNGSTEPCLTARYFLADASNIGDIYKDIAGEIAEASYAAQKASISGNFSITSLYNDSFIEFNYTPYVPPQGVEELAFTFQSKMFENCSPVVDISAKLRVLDAKVLSYSGPHWTDLLTVQNPAYEVDYNLSGYGVDYAVLGDPFVVQAHSVDSGVNQFNLSTGDSPTQFTNCSLNNSLIYTASAKASTSYTPVLPDSEGCSWTIDLYDGSQLVGKLIPDTYAGANTCEFTNPPVFDSNDAYQLSVYQLLTQLDFDDDFKIDVNLIDLGVDFSDVVEVPYLWGPTIVKMEFEE